jgi:hypothetical protein
MSTPQQPELHRSRHTWVDPDHAADMAEVARKPRVRGRSGSIPPDNRPGHHPEVEQDQPDRPPPAGARQPDARSSTSDQEPSLPRRFRFEFDPLLVPAAVVFGITPSRAFALIDEHGLTIRFGRWVLQTPLSNVRSITPSGPYAWWKVAGPPRLSIADRGITFATTTRQGLCVMFHEPVTALLPVPVLRHPAATITLASPKAFTDTVASRTGHPVPTK